MIYITGDTHGNINRFSDLSMPDEHLWTADDYLIVCGDFGFVFADDELERRQLDELAKKPYTILFVDGNHENFHALYRYPEQSRFGGRVHVIRNNIFHLMRGQVYDICGKSFLAMGGAYSIDRFVRKKNLSYWDEELPCNSEYREAAKSIAERGNKVDYIITHTAPREIIRRMGYYPDPHDMELTGFLEWIMYECRFKRWFFGHWHEDKVVDGRFRALFYEVEKVGE